MTTSNRSSCTATIGQGSKKWYFSGDNKRSFDLTHEPPNPDKAHLKVKVSTGASVLVSPAKSALVIIDMQNYFLSEALGREYGAGHKAYAHLLQEAIPAARKAGLQIVWLNWGLVDEDLKTMPPAVTRCFGFPATKDGEEVILDRHGNARKDRAYGGLGADMGKVTIPGMTGETNAGRLLYRDTWNADLYGELKQQYQPERGDVWIHKNRMSGLWGSSTPFKEFLEKQGLTTLFFAGVNTDQCVGGTLTDAFSNGYDCILLKNGCGTTSPTCAQEAWEFNCENTFGFVVSCEDLWDATGRPSS